SLFSRICRCWAPNSSSREICKFSVISLLPKFYPAPTFRPRHNSCSGGVDRRYSGRLLRQPLVQGECYTARNFMGSGEQIGQGMDRLVLAPTARRDAILELLRSARQTITLSMFRCDDFTILDEVAAAVQRGVHVRILITQRASGWKKKLQELTLLLKSLGADVRPYESSVMKYHAKYIVADDGPALVTSLNFTRKCFESTRDFLVFSEDPEVV